MKEFDFGSAVNLQIFLSIDPFLLNEAAVGLLDLVVPEVIFHIKDIFLPAGDLPKESTPGQEEQDVRPGELHAGTKFSNLKIPVLWALKRKGFTPSIKLAKTLQFVLRSS